MRFKLITISISIILASICITNIAQAQAVPFFGEAKNICELIKNVFYFGVSLAGITAMLVIMIGGIIYMVSFGSEEKKKTGMDLMGGALKGLLLALFSWTIFYIINPYLLRCKVPVLEVEVPELTAPPGGEVTPHGDPCVNIPQDLLYDNPECKKDDTVQCVGDEECVACTGEETIGLYWCSSCGKGLVENAQRYIGTCYGPCHCAHFVSSILVASGCPSDAYHPSVEGVEGWLIGIGWEKVSPPQAGDIAFQGGDHIGIMSSSTKSIHTRVIKEAGVAECPGCTTEGGSGPFEACYDCAADSGIDPRGNWVTDQCQSNQCVSEQAYPNWTYYYRPSWQTGS